MDPAHRDILRRHRAGIVNDLNVDRVKDSLIQNGVFDAVHWEDIATAGKGTRHDKASALMDELPRRGPRAFWSFCESLMTAGYDFLAKPLIEEESGTGTGPDLDLILWTWKSRTAKELQKVPTVIFTDILSRRSSHGLKGFPTSQGQTGITAISPSSGGEITSDFAPPLLISSPLPPVNEDSLEEEEDLPTSSPRPLAGLSQSLGELSIKPEEQVEAMSKQLEQVKAEHMSEKLEERGKAKLAERLNLGPEERKLQTESCTVTVPPGAASEANLQVISPNDVTIPLNDGEMLVSDVIELGPHGTAFRKPVTVQMQYHDMSSDGAREPVMLVTEDKSQWKVLATTAKSEGELIGSINHSCTIAIAAQLKEDQFSVSSERTRVTSSTHPAVQIIFPEKSVPTPIRVNIQVQDVPKETIEAMKVNLRHRRGLISASPIVNVETDSTVKFDKPVTVRVPHPQHYMGTRHIGSPKLRVMSRDEGVEDWVDVTNDVRIRVIGDFVEFKVNHFTSYVVLEIESSSGDLVELGRIPLEMCKWIHQCDVKFILLQQEDNPNALLIECHKASKAERKFAKLKRQGYRGPAPSETVRLREGQRVEVSLVGNVSFASFCRFSKHLVFHSKMNPRLNIVAKADQVRGEEGLEGVGFVAFFALPKILVEKSKERRARVYDYFYDIKEGVSTKWGDLAFHLGFKWADINNIAGRNRDDKTSCMDMLCEWQSREGNDATIDVLKEALLKAELRNVVDELNVKFFSTKHFLYR
ncbi:positive regulation of extrinsic apoptotic signaling pathway via death domain receptors protein [Branchiostoma belcheri]|nr:positive regulation of extrinsic apoptotic signaling pathway via death domain receptors protein [Branchiostoma belcheri]